MYYTNNKVTRMFTNEEIKEENNITTNDKIKIKSFSKSRFKLKTSFFTIFKDILENSTYDFITIIDNYNNFLNDMESNYKEKEDYNDSECQDNNYIVNDYSSS